MGNTKFFQETSDLKKNFKWKEIFSEVRKPHTSEQKEKLLVSGCETYMPKESNMLKEWEKPWMFAKFGTIGLLFVVLMWFLVYFVAAAYSIIAMLLVVPAFVMPLTILIFFWEMNIPRNISILDLIKYVMFAGAISGVLTFVIRNILLIGNDAAAHIGGPIPEEIAKFALVYLLIKKKDSKYILNGLLIGCAVGVGFAAQESAGYAVMLYDEVGFSQAQSTNIMRGILALGGHSVWASLYGAALVAAKKTDTLKISHIADKLVLITFFSAIILHFIWNYDTVDFLARFADLTVTYSIYTVLEVYYGKYIILILIAWIINFKLLRMGMVQAIDIGNRAAKQQPVNNAQTVASPAVQQVFNPASVVGITGVYSGQRFSPNVEGKILFGRDSMATVRYQQGTQGISSRHCEIKIVEGVPVLIDRGSTYGTFFADGSKLEVNRPYRISNGTVFYLATKENQFEVKL